MDKQLLETRLTIIMVREDKNFLTTFNEFQSLLIKYFKFAYSLDEIESALFRLEEAYIVNQADEEHKIATIINEEQEEDFI